MVSFFEALILQKEIAERDLKGRSRAKKTAAIGIVDGSAGRRSMGIFVVRLITAVGTTAWSLRSEGIFYCGGLYKRT